MNNKWLIGFNATFIIQEEVVIERLSVTKVKQAYYHVIFD